MGKVDIGLSVIKIRYIPDTTEGTQMAPLRFAGQGVGLSLFGAFPATKRHRFERIDLYRPGERQGNLSIQQPQAVALGSIRYPKCRVRGFSLAEKALSFFIPVCLILIAAILYKRKVFSVGDKVA